MNRSKNFCVWHTGRCGSTVLSSMLNQHSQIYCTEELLEGYSKLYKRLKYKPLAWLGSKLLIRYAMLNNYAEIFGLEMKVWHLYRLDANVSEAMNFLALIGINKHIVLERQNYLRVIASSNVSKKRSSWHIRSENKPTLTKVYVDPGGLAYAIQTFSDFYNELKVLLGENCLWLTYEKDILQNPQAAFDKVVNFLELNQIKPKISLGQTNPYPLKEIVLNFDEISNKLKNTPHEWMLEF